ncbi:MAG: hypothetical protein LBL59_09205 [Xanthomonadaceae bacterium]|jgi:hypothetical protein|nr:hypothetical protein [Xanthomonadaceae bacterium]
MSRCPRRLLLLLPATLASTICMVGAEACVGDQAERARVLYAHLAADSGQDPGLPPQQTMPELSPGLQADIETERSVQRRFMQACPEGKPPYIEGSLFERFGQGEDARAVPGAIAGRAAATLLRLRYDPPAHVSQATPAAWEDRTWMRCEQGRWRIDDVEYPGDRSFGRGTRLRDCLHAERR